MESGHCVGRGLTLNHTIQSFNDLKEKGLGNTMGKGENAGYQHSIFSFSRTIFYCINKRDRHFSNVQFVVCKCFQFGHVQNIVVWQRVKYHLSPHLDCMMILRFTFTVPVDSVLKPNLLRWVPCKHFYKHVAKDKEYLTLFQATKFKTGLNCKQLPTPK